MSTAPYRSFVVSLKFVQEILKILLLCFPSATLKICHAPPPVLYSCTLVHVLLSALEKAAREASRGKVMMPLTAHNRGGRLTAFHTEATRSVHLDP